MEPSDDVLRGLLAAAPDALLAVDPDGRIVFVNDQVEQLFGWSKADLVGQAIEQLVPAHLTNGHPSLRAGYMAGPRARPMGAGLQLSAQRKDGSTFPAEISLSAVTDEPGDQLVLAAVRDVTDRLELEAVRRREALAEHREQSHRLESLGQLAGGVAHDFNNLLGVILNYTTLVARRVSDPTAEGFLDEIRAAAERAAGLTTQLLTFARRDVVHAEPLDLNAIVRDLAAMLDRTLGEHIELRLELPSAPLVVLGDRHRLEQIVLNLAINARDAMPHRGTLTIATERSTRPRSDGSAEVEPQAIVRVMDTGGGMPPEVVARAFEPFFTTKPTGEGTGLGLATVYGIVQQSGGEITIDSEVDRGTTVTVVLPGAPDVEPGPRAIVESSTGGTERILLVEDEPALRDATAQLLVERGYEVLVASDGLDALEVFDRDAGTIDLVLSDVAMPRMRGDELALRLAERQRGLQVILMSGYDSGDAPLTGRMLAKPVPEDVLFRTIRAVLDG
jgi:PAS domain S-box-containing protein